MTLWLDPLSMIKVSYLLDLIRIPSIQINSRVPWYTPNRFIHTNLKIPNCIQMDSTPRIKVASIKVKIQNWPKVAIAFRGQFSHCIYFLSVIEDLSNRGILGLIPFITTPNGLQFPICQSQFLHVNFLRSTEILYPCENFELMLQHQQDKFHSGKGLEIGQPNIQELAIQSSTKNKWFKFRKFCLLWMLELLDPSG